MTRTGFALVYVAALLLVLEIALWTVTRFFSSVITRDHYVEYNKELDRAEEEILDFLKKYRRFPNRTELTRPDGSKYYLLDDNETQLKEFFYPRSGSKLGYFGPSSVDVCSIGPAQYIRGSQGNAPVEYQKPYFMEGYTEGQNRKLHSNLTYCKGGLNATGECEQVAQAGGGYIDNDTAVGDIAFFVVHPGENGVFEANFRPEEALNDSGAEVFYPRDNDDIVRYYSYQEVFNLLNCNYRLSLKPTFERRTTLGRPRGANTGGYANYGATTGMRGIPYPDPYYAGGSGGPSGSYTGGPNFNGVFTPLTDAYYWNTDYPPYYRTYMVTFEHMRDDAGYSTGGEVPTCVAQCSWTSVFKPHEYATCVYAEGSWALWWIRGGKSKLDQAPVTWATTEVPSPTQSRSQGSTGGVDSVTNTINSCEARVRRDVYQIEFPINRNGQNFDSESCCLAFDRNDVLIAATNCAVRQGNINGCTANDTGSLQPGDFPYLRIAASEIPKVKGNRIFITQDDKNIRHYTQGKLISDGIRFNMYMDRGNTRYEIHADTPIVDFMP